MNINFRKPLEKDFDFVKSKVSEKNLSFDDINQDVSFIGIREDNEIVTYILLSNNRDNLPEILKQTDAYTYKVVDIYMKEGHEDDLSRTSFHLIKSLNQYAFLWCDFNINIPRCFLKAALLDEIKDIENNNHFYFINTLFAGTLNEENT